MYHVPTTATPVSSEGVVEVAAPLQGVVVGGSVRTTYNIIYNIL